MRPVAAKLDQLSAEDMIASGSELWTVLEKAKSLGLNLIEMEELPPLERARLLDIAIEELSWGCPGLAGAILVTFFPVMFSLLAGNMEMAKYCDGRLGWWAITEPDHGSDMLDSHGEIAYPEGRYGRANCLARIEGDRVIINGQKSAWVSGATYADVCVLYTQVEQNGVTGPGLAIIVDLDSKGVSKGKPLEKMGLRALNQGEIFFDNVEVPLSHVIAGPDKYNDFVTATLSEANPHVAAMVMGTMRAAYEYALGYAHERKAGGVPLIQHQHVRYRLFHMFRKVEMARAMLHRVTLYNATSGKPALHASAAAKVSVTQLAFEVANEALQMFGGNGMTREYPLEKIVRDTRACLIADGCNEVLAIKGGTKLINPALLEGRVGGQSTGIRFTREETIVTKTNAVGKQRAFWAVLPVLPAPELAELARQYESLGFEGVFSVQVYGPPFIPLAAASTVTTRLGLGTGVAIAAARSPIETAMAARYRSRPHQPGTVDPGPGQQYLQLDLGYLRHTGHQAAGPPARHCRGNPPHRGGRPPWPRAL